MRKKISKNVTLICQECGNKFEVEKYFKEPMKKQESEIRNISKTRDVEERASNSARSE